MATVGDRIDKFTLVRQLGAGGMGATWEAVRQVGRDFEQRVAIKLAEPELLRTPDGLASFRREAALAASLRHPNIAAVLDVDDKAGYIVCELVDGADLRGVLRSVPGGRLEPSLVVHLLAQIARGLNHAHRRILRGRPSPVIHRDMSPGNVVVDYDGNVKIVDFGIAKVLSAGAATETAESVKGKLSYMAPEQAMGGRMDGRVDQYAVGVIAYEALSGVRPNDGAHEGETLGCILEGRHVPLHERVSGLPPGLSRVVERMLALRPADRFENIDAVLDALAEFTPKLTVHRSLIPLVMAARQPHTILSENGRFVSRPVEQEPLLRAAAAHVAEPQQIRVSITPPSRPPARRPQHPHVAALAVTLGNTQASHWEAQLPQLEAAKSAPPPLPVPSQPPPVPVVSEPPPPAAQTRPRSGRMFWKGMTALGVLLLALVIWFAFFPHVLHLAPDLWPGIERFSVGGGSAEPARADPNQLVRPAPMGAVADGAGTTGSSARASAAEPDDVPPEPGEPAAATSMSTSTWAAQAQAVASADLPNGTAVPELRSRPGVNASNTNTNTIASTSLAPDALVRVRVRVRPGGKVWLDERPAGDAAPELEMSVAPGAHVVAVGNEQGPIQRRNVQFSTDKLHILRFDLPADSR